jgi:hypothetical protein
VATAYTYDADGNRVEKVSGGTGTLYWYMTPGIVGESDPAGVMKSEYVFFGGERVARRDLVAPTGVAYYFSDHLKTASVITDAAATSRPSPIITPGAENSSSSTTIRTTTNSPAKNGTPNPDLITSARGITPTAWGGLSRQISLLRINMLGTRKPGIFIHTSATIRCA